MDAVVAGRGDVVGVETLEDRLDARSLGRRYPDVEPSHIFPLGLPLGGDSGTNESARVSTPWGVASTAVMQTEVTSGHHKNSRPAESPQSGCGPVVISVRQNLLAQIHRGEQIFRKVTEREAMNCIFCAIVAGEEDAVVVDETDETIAFVPREPVSEGHLPVIPKAHYENLFDVPEPILRAVMKHAKSIAEELHADDFDGVNLLHASGKAAQQSVPPFPYPPRSTSLY